MTNLGETMRNSPPPLNNCDSVEKRWKRVEALEIWSGQLRQESGEDGDEKELAFFRKYIFFSKFSRKFISKKFILIGIPKYFSEQN